MDKSHEMIQLIVHSSDAKKHFIKAILNARNKKWDEANNYFQLGQDSLQKAKVASEVIFDKEDKNKIQTTSYTTVYAHNQLTSPLTVYELGLEMIDKIKPIQNKLLKN